MDKLLVCPDGYKQNFESGDCEFAGDTGYSSHGRWSTIKKIREVEVEDRGNPFPKTKLPNDTPAIWINFDKRMTLRYLVFADDWERIDDKSNKLTKKDRELMEDIYSIPLKKADKIIFGDEDEGYLLVRPKQI